MLETDKRISKIGWNFDNSYATLPEIFYTEQVPTTVRAPSIQIMNKKLAKTLGFHNLTSSEVLETFGGNQIPKGAKPIAQAYAGHQFGQFTMLGDGRAILLGEHITPDKKRIDIQLKGGGRTLYSRGGDGRAALGPMLREYLISEAMYALRIPTTRSLAVVTTGEVVEREKSLDGAILTRVASSHLRVGTFQFAAHWGTEAELQVLADYAIQRHFPTVANNKNPYIAFLQEVIKRQAETIAKWQLVGFVHGVMNTDNMTISGETIDYGPCAFIDYYDPSIVFSSIDDLGRYAYGNQPQIGKWNLVRFAEALLPLLDRNENTAVELANKAIASFETLFYQSWFDGMKEKLGLMDDDASDKSLISELLQIMKQYRADYTNTFRSLTLQNYPSSLFYESIEFELWHKKWQERIKRQGKDLYVIQQFMCQHNPAIIPRNYYVEAALSAAVDNNEFELFHRLHHALENPFAYTEEQEEFVFPPKERTPYRTFCGT